MALMTGLLGSKNPNPSLATILMPTISFAQRRADKQADLIYTQKLFELEQQRLQEKQAQEKKVRDAFNYVNTLDILAPDKQRLQVYSDSMEQAIVDKIKNKYGGNIRKYMMEEGEADLYDYQQKLISSDYMKDALTNKTNKGQYDIADVDGKVHRKVSWTTSDGTKKTGSFEEAYLDYANFKTQKLNYNGAYEPPKKTHEYFSKTYSPRGWYVGDEPTPEEVYAAYVGEGMTPEDAADYYDRYYASGMYKYKMGDKDAMNLKISEYNLKVDKAKIDAERLKMQDYWKKMAYNLSVARLNAQDRHWKEMEKAKKASGEYNYMQQDMAGLVDSEGKIIHGKVVSLDGASLNEALGSAGGDKQRPINDAMGYMGDPASGNMKAIKFNNAAGYATGKMMGFNKGGAQTVLSETVIEINKAQAIELGIWDEGWFSGDISDEFKGQVVKDGNVFKMTVWLEFNPPDNADVIYGRAVGGKTLRAADGYNSAPTDFGDGADYSDDVGDYEE